MQTDEIKNQIYLFIGSAHLTGKDTNWEAKHGYQYLKQMEARIKLV